MNTWENMLPHGRCSRALLWGDSRGNKTGLAGGTGVRGQSLILAGTVVRLLPRLGLSRQQQLCAGSLLQVKSKSSC